jgi:hypothetical protein
MAEQDPVLSLQSPRWSLHIGAHPRPCASSAIPFRQRHPGRLLPAGAEVARRSLPLRAPHDVRPHHSRARVGRSVQDRGDQIAHGGVAGGIRVAQLDASLDPLRPHSVPSDAEVATASSRRSTASPSGRVRPPSWLSRGPLPETCRKIPQGSTR